MGINALANIAILSTIIYNKKSKKKDDVEKYWFFYNLGSWNFEFSLMITKHI